MDHKNLQDYRDHVISTIPNERGVYVLRDWFQAGLYVGASTEGIRSRLRRHNTSARSDLIASGRLCVSEIAFIDIVEIQDPFMIRKVESAMIHLLNDHRPIFNSRLPKTRPTIPLPQFKTFQLVPDEEIARMREPLLVCEHHSDMLKKIIAYAKTTKDNAAIRHCINIRRSFFNYHAENLLDA